MARRVDNELPDRLRLSRPSSSQRDLDFLYILFKQTIRDIMAASCASSSAVSVSRKVAVRSTLVGSPGALRLYLQYVVNILHK